MIQAIQLILALSILVVIHELGHYLFARLFNTRVEKFYMFFNPKKSIIRAKKINGKWQVKFFADNVPSATVVMKDAMGEDMKDAKGQIMYRPMTQDELQALDEDDWRRYPDNTEWGLGWVPFGGYCSISGMVDETKSMSDLPSEPQPWEFRSKNVWQRMCIIIGGVLVNFIAAMVIFSALLYTWGSDKMPIHNLKEGLYFSDFLLDEGFEQHDNILTIDGQVPQDLSSIVQSIIIEGKQDVVVLRGQDTIALKMSQDLGNRYLALQQKHDKIEREKSRDDENYVRAPYVLISEFIPFIIDSVPPMSPAALCGLQKDDHIVSIAGNATPAFYDVQNVLKQHLCDTVQINYYRGDSLMSTYAFIGDQGKLGVFAYSKYHYLTLEHTSYTFWESIPAGIAYGWDFLVSYVKQFRLVFSKEGVQSLGGFAAIGNMFPKTWDWFSFWHITAILSLILAFMNFLPIPALDGGYILFLLVEMITGKQPSDKFLEIANTIGWWLLLALLILANGNDIFRIFF